MLRQCRSASAVAVRTRARAPACVRRLEAAARSSRLLPVPCPIARRAADLESVRLPLSLMIRRHRVPILLVHGGRDRRSCRRAIGRALFAAAPEPKETGMVLRPTRAPRATSAVRRVRAVLTSSTPSASCQVARVSPSASRSNCSPLVFRPARRNAARSSGALASSARHAARPQPLNGLLSPQVMCATPPVMISCAVPPADSSCGAAAD